MTYRTQRESTRWLMKTTGSFGQAHKSSLCTLRPAWSPCRILEPESLKWWWMPEGRKRYAKSRQGCPHLILPRIPRLRAVSIPFSTISSRPSAALRTAGGRADGGATGPITKRGLCDRSVGV